VVASIVEHRKARKKLGMEDDASNGANGNTNSEETPDYGSPTSWL
jgi:hypothetical protein